MSGLFPLKGESRAAKACWAKRVAENAGEASKTQHVQPHHVLPFGVLLLLPIAAAGSRLQTAPVVPPWPAEELTSQA